MLALRSMLSGTYYAHYYASIIGGSLHEAKTTTSLKLALSIISMALFTRDTLAEE